ncbi:MAG: hypothetical protein SOR40_08245, partial [Rothia sp. (in: high G+C Gram-positive bacteria)]|nr:hypothetical protein [Rothia sp. (in: high G+C Gram-positive bacteria)]
MNSKIFISSFLAALIYIPSSLGALQATSTVNGSIRDSQIKLSTGDDIALPTVDTFRNEQNYFNDQPKASTASVEDFKSSAVNELINMSNSISTRDNSSTIVPCAAENASSIKIMVPSDFENSHKDSFGISYYCKAKTTEAEEPTNYPLPDGSLITLPEPIILTIQDLQELGITPTPIHQQNPPHTLKNYNTNFWAEPNPQEFHTQINGVPVTARAIPTHYTFDYGDGRKYTTTHPGYRLADDVWDEPTPTSHQYSRAGDYVFTLSTYYRGEFSVAGGPWQVMA